VLFHVVTVRYSGMIASLGQTPAQVPQSMQVLGRIKWISPAEIASTGHSPMQVPQATQESVIL